MPDNPTCPVCHSDQQSLWARARDIEYPTQSGEFEYLRCQDCRCLYIHPMPVDQLGKIYPPNYYSYAQDGKSLLQGVKAKLDARIFRRLLNQLEGDNLAVLDVGGGAGQQLSLLRGIEPRIRTSQVVDLDSAAQARAEAAGHRYFCGTIEAFATDQKYDLIIMLNIIEHVADPAAVLEKARDMLSAQGRILIKTPNTNSLDARLFRQRNWAGLHCPRHWVLFDLDNFTRLCEQLKLQVHQSKLTQGAPFWAGSLVHWLSPRTGTLDGPYPSIPDHPLYGLFCGLFAVIDILRSPFAPTSQMFFELGRQQAVTPQPGSTA